MGVRMVPSSQVPFVISDFDLLLQPHGGKQPPHLINVRLQVVGIGHHLLIAGASIGFVDHIPVFMD